MASSKKWTPVVIYVSTFVTYGAVYAFTLLYPLIKKKLNFSQKDIDFAGTAFYAGSNLLGYFLAPPIARALPVPVAVGIVGVIQPLCQMLIGMTTLGLLITPWYIFAMFYLLLGFSSGCVFNLVTQQLINIFPSSQASLAVAIPSCSHAFGGMIFSVIISVVPVSYFFILLVLLQLIFTCLTVICVSTKRTSELKPLLETTESQVKQFTSSEVLTQLFSSSTFYLCILCAGIMVGCGTSLMTNVGNMAQSLDISVSQGAIITQFAQFVGRASISLLYYACPWPADTLDVAVILTLFYSFIFYSVAFSNNISSLQFAVFNLAFGAAYGAGWTIVGNFTRYTVRPEKQYWTDVCAVIYPSTAFGTFLFNYFIGVFYDKNVQAGDIDCFGVKCYQTSFSIVGTFAIITVFCLLILRQRTSSRVKDS